MRQYRLTIGLIAVLALGASIWGRGTAAQDASPTAVALPISPDPTLCTIDPRPLADFEALVALPDASPTAAAKEPTSPFAPPIGQPADAETTAAVTQTAVELFACYAAGDFLRASALWTDDYLHDLDAEAPYTDDDLGFLAASPVPDDVEVRPTLLALREIVMLPDGRVGSFLDVAYADGSTETQYGIVALVDDRYRLDEIAFVGPLPGTPTPIASPATADAATAELAAVLERYRVSGNSCDAEARASLFAVPYSIATRGEGETDYVVEQLTSREQIVEAYRCDGVIVDQERVYDQIDIRPAGDSATISYRYQVLTHETDGCSLDGGTTTLEVVRQPSGKWLIAKQISDYLPTQMVSCP